MTIEEAAMAIYEEAAHQGEPLTLDVCRQIAQRLLIPRHLTNLLPGEIAQKHRERYEDQNENENENENQKTDAVDGNRKHRDREDH